MRKFGWKQVVACAAVISVLPAAGMAANVKAKAAGTAQIYNVTADMDVVVASKTPLDVVVCNMSDTLGRGAMKKPDVEAKESFGVPARSCAIVNGTSLLELDTSETPGPWMAMVTVGPAKP